MGNSSQNGNLAWTGHGEVGEDLGRTPLSAQESLSLLQAKRTELSGRVQGRQTWGGPSSLPGDMER